VRTIFGSAGTLNRALFCDYRPRSLAGRSAGLEDVSNARPPLAATPPLEQAPQDWLYLNLDGRSTARTQHHAPWAVRAGTTCAFSIQERSTLVDRKVEDAWLPVVFISAALEHAVQHR